MTYAARTPSARPRYPSWAVWLTRMTRAGSSPMGDGKRAAAAIGRYLDRVAEGVPEVPAAPAVS
ncbi:hypothetical protein BH24CHL9_BH24CHL9_10240 [soil metagenome]